MPRQPLPGKYYDSPKEIYNTLPAASRLTPLVGLCVSAATNVDLQLALCIGSLLGIENTASVAIFSVLRRSNIVRDGLSAAARHSLDERDQELFLALLRMQKSLDSQRNDIVHGCWGKIEGIEDSFLWLSTESYATYLIQDYHHGAIGTLTSEWRITSLNKILYLWKLSEIEGLVKDFECLRHAFGNFHAYHRYRNEEAGKNALKDLTKDLLVKRALKEYRET